jgi:AraC-like DNA-binding protein
MDVLSDVLDTIRLKGTVFASTELPAPWGIRAEPRSHYAFHIVARGQCWLETDGACAVHVSAGDVVLLSRGQGHALRDAPGSALRPLGELLAEGAFQAPVQGTPGSTHLVCGCFQFDDVRGDILLSSLPAVVHTHEMHSDAGPWLAQTVKLLAYESARDLPGSATVINRLCDALFVYVVRSVVAKLPEGQASWLRALVVPQVGAALRLMHENPGDAWDVATLAARVGMSRSAFAEQFNEVVGETPMKYLHRWRMRKAARMLRAGEAAISEVALRVGYESGPAFNKAFKRAMGAAPGAYRRSALLPRERSV